MRGENQSCLLFLLLGLSRQPQQQQHLLFIFFLNMYLVMVLADLLVLWAISTNSHLHTPMDFFLSNLSFMDICFSTVPKMLANQVQAIFPGCPMQISFLFMLMDMDSFLLALMAYNNHFVIICHPLHYSAKMIHHLCDLLVTRLWVIANLDALLYTLLMAQASFCADNTIPHLFCDAIALLKFSCSDTHLNEMMILFFFFQIIRKSLFRKLQR
ncbi:LOW QUALITY PROTEIN: olfactory receptor 1F1 [Molossus nigricans]